MRLSSPPSLRLGLCCQFAVEPIKFCTTTPTSLRKLARIEQLHRLSELCLANTEALLALLPSCAGHGISGFCINRRILTLKTHPVAAYAVTDLPVHRSAAWLLAPYLAWVSFATVLNFTLWRLNS